MKNKMTIRKFWGVPHRLKHTTLTEEFGKKYKDTFWIECDEKGNTVDINGDGTISHQHMLCFIKPGQDDIDLATLKEECLYKNNAGQVIYDESKK